MQQENLRQRGNPIGVTGQSFARNARRYRRFNDLSLRDLADRLNEQGRSISVTALSKMENGSRRVDVDDAVAICAVLGVSFDSLIE